MNVWLAKALVDDYRKIIEPLFLGKSFDNVGELSDYHLEWHSALVESNPDFRQIEVGDVNFMLEYRADSLGAMQIYVIEVMIRSII